MNSSQEQNHESIKTLEAAADLHVHWNVSRVIQDEIENQTDLGIEIVEHTPDVDDDGDEIFIYKYWTVSEQFAYIARSCGEVIYETPFGIVWGHQTMGAPLEIDHALKNILKRIVGS